MIEQKLINKGIQVMRANCLKSCKICDIEKDIRVCAFSSQDRIKHFVGAINKEISIPLINILIELSKLQKIVDDPLQYKPLPLSDLRRQTPGLLLKVIFDAYCTINGYSYILLKNLDPNLTIDQVLNKLKCALRVNDPENDNDPGILINSMINFMKRALYRDIYHLLEMFFKNTLEALKQNEEVRQKIEDEQINGILLNGSRILTALKKMNVSFEKDSLKEKLRESLKENKGENTYNLSVNIILKYLYPAEKEWKKKKEPFTILSSIRNADHNNSINRRGETEMEHNLYDFSIGANKPINCASWPHLITICSRITDEVGAILLHEKIKELKSINDDFIDLMVPQE